jgi:hypothetical protein
VIEHGLRFVQNVTVEPGDDLSQQVNEVVTLRHDQGLKLEFVTTATIPAASTTAA